MHDRSWVEINGTALRENIQSLVRLAGDSRVLCAIVKANAYGHGIREVAEVLERERAFCDTPSPDAPVGTSRSPSNRGGEIRGWFGVDCLREAQALRDLRIRRPIIVLGYIPIADARTAIRTGARITVAAPETIRALASAARALRRKAILHVKVETGTQRQGVALRDLPAIVRMIERSPFITLEGISTHLADVEDTGPDGFAALQLERFAQACTAAERITHRHLLRHTSASAAAMLFPDARFDLIRPGIALYGLWPSEQTRDMMTRRSRLPTPSPDAPDAPDAPVGTSPVGTSRSPSIGEGEKLKEIFTLHPVLTWKTIIGPMHWAPVGAPVGYGCAERVRRRTRIAVLPIGYWDGYDRGLSSIGEVLVRGRRCKVIGRVCMNMIMVDVTDVPRVHLEDEVTLIGHQGKQTITADDLAGKIGTINYEVVTRINPMLPRRIV